MPDQSPADRPCARWHSPGPSRGTLYRRVAFYMARLLKGAKPADVPVEQLTKFELVIHLKTVKEQGRTIPPTVLLQPDEGLR